MRSSGSRKGALARSALDSTRTSTLQNAARDPLSSTRDLPHLLPDISRLRKVEGGGCTWTRRVSARAARSNSLPIGLAAAPFPPSADRQAI